MSISTIKRKIAGNLHNFRGWRTNRKFLVVESDDWGALRMPSRKVYDSMLKHGVAVDRCAYNRLDGLETPEDLSNLFDVLSGFRDSNGRYAVITANMIVANPDFEKIRTNGFSRYEFETFIQTFERFGLRSIKVQKQGIESGVFHPQLHGREHLQVNRWLTALRSNFPETKVAFDHGVYGISTTITAEKRRTYLAAFDYEHSGEQNDICGIVEDAAQIFESAFGYRSASFIAPNYVWDDTVEKALSKVGVQTLQGMRFQKFPVFQHLRGSSHSMGDQNQLGQYYLVRNCMFEPALVDDTATVVEECLAQISNAFRWRKPAIISSHRLNFIGSIDERNAGQNLVLLKTLFRKILKKWPDVEFVTSDQLGNLMQGHR